MTALTQIINDFSSLSNNHKEESLNNMQIVIEQLNNLYQDLLIKTEGSYASIINESENFSNIGFFLPNKEEISSWTNWYEAFVEDSEKHARDGHNFNIFYLLRDEFGFNIQEAMHSKLIKFLLDARSSHGQGNKFLIEFLNLLNVDNPERGIWNITVEQGRIDILIKRREPETIIIIENKSNWAGDQGNQLYRYWHSAIYSRTKKTDEEFYLKNKNKYQIIYLAPNYNKEISEHSLLRPGSWGKNLPEKMPVQLKTVYFNEFIQDWLEKCKEKLPENNHRVKEYITQYQILCNNL